MTLSPTGVRHENVDALFMVWLVCRSTEDLLDTVLGPAGFTGDDFAIYSVLVAAPWIAAPATTVSSYVKRLEARRHLTSFACPTRGTAAPTKCV